MHNLGRSLTVKVSSIIQEDRWIWPRPRNPIIQTIMNATPKGLVPDCSSSDSVHWNLTAGGVYTYVRSAWEAFRKHHPPFLWHNIIWFKHHTPRWSFIQWLAVFGAIIHKRSSSFLGFTFPHVLFAIGRMCPTVICFSPAALPRRFGPLLWSCNRLLIGHTELPGVLAWTKKFRGSNSLTHSVFKLSLGFIHLQVV